MKKVHVMLLALVAMFAFSAFLAGSASAATTLLAEWLVEGAAIPAETTVETEVKGGLLLEDTETLAGKAAVLCEGIADGNVGPNGEDETKEILNLAKEKIEPLGGLALLCATETTCAAATEASPIEVWPVGLPWLTLLFLEEEAGVELFLNLITTTVEEPTEKKLLVGYELLCLVLGLNVEDKCTAEDFEIEVVNDSDTLDAAIPAGALTTPNANCSQSSGKATGINQADELTPILLVNKKLLTVSE